MKNTKKMKTICIQFHIMAVLFLTAINTLAFSQSINSVNFNALVGENSKITVKAETEKYYWIGTTNGLYQVKKKNMKVYRITTDNSVLPDNYITAICTRSTGEVFVGTPKGMLRYDTVAFLTLTTENARLSANFITALYCDKYDRVWIGTAGNCVSAIKIRGMKNYGCVFPADLNDYITTFNFDGNEQVVAIMKSGTKMKFNNDGFEMLAAK